VFIWLLEFELFEVDMDLEVEQEERVFHFSLAVLVLGICIHKFFFVVLFSLVSSSLTSLIGFLVVVFGFLLGFKDGVDIVDVHCDNDLILAKDVVTVYAST